MTKLLSNASTNPKTAKLLEEFGYEAVIHHMTPDTLADGVHTVCAWSTPGCRATCLNTAGRSQISGDLTTKNLEMYMIHRSRITKTLDFFADRQGYADKLAVELVALEARAIKKQLTPVARLNGTSDVPWENYIPMEALSNTKFYDYTKSEQRVRNFIAGKLPYNYDLTYSYHEYTAPGLVRRLTNQGANVAVVFRSEMPGAFQGVDVISGMEHDFRFMDKKGCVVGLIARGRARHDTSGFVVDV
jgi:hypothetical protein